jgi:hypothetical protein
MGHHLERDKLIGQLNVFGVELYTDVDYRQIKGVSATEEPCLRGYERSFDALDVIIGYGFDKKIRKIHTRNVTTSLFGIRPGMIFDEGRKKILQAGFTEYLPPFTYRANKYTLKFLVGSDNKIFGLTLEALD